VVELADALVSETSVFGREGSTPSRPTIFASQEAAQSQGAWEQHVLSMLVMPHRE
jgi:hypothetical protein